MTYPEKHEIRQNYIVGLRVTAAVIGFTAVSSILVNNDEILVDAIEDGLQLVGLAEDNIENDQFPNNELPATFED